MATMTSQTEAAQGTSLDIRVEDFLDDKLQSTTDLEDLDSLLANVELQRNQLQSQLDNAVKELEEARRTADDRQGKLAARINEFEKLQESIIARQQVDAASDGPDQAIARLREPMKKLEAVELAQKYLTLLQDVEKNRSEARSHLPQSPKAALEPYTKLRQLSTKLTSLPGQEGLHLVSYVEKVTDSLWDEMKKIMSAELETVLSQRKWPKVDVESEMDEEWLNCFEKLVDLQVPEVLYNPGLVPLLPIDVMASIFVSEFRYHFLSDKPSSSPQAFGNHCLPWFLAHIEKWETFFRDNLGHLLVSKFHDTPAANNMAYVDPVCALITSMLPVLEEKALVVAQEAVKSPPFLSGFMSQLMNFDDKVRLKFSYDGGDAENGWPGLTTHVLDEHFDTWFKAEKDFALERLQTIMESQEARNIDYDYAEKGKMKPTHAAVQITHLLRSITGQYARVRNFKHKIRFLIDIQLAILDHFHDRLRGSLEAYQSITSTIGRTLHAVTKEDIAALEGTGALETLVKVIGSADHVVNTLKDWSNEEVFVSLWDELQTRSAHRRSQGITSTMSYDDVKNRTSATGGDEGDDGALFDETVAAYSQRRKAGQDLLVGALVESHSKAFRAYCTRVQWTTVGDTAVLDDLTITPELDEPLRILRRNFDFLAKALSTAAFRRVWRDALSKLQDLLWNDVLLRHSFTAYGAAQFHRDGTAISTLIEHYITGGSSALDSLHEGLRLLNLPVEASEEGALTLKEGSDRVFTDNDAARKVLEELELEALSPPVARKILLRRVENSENVGW
ncbi:TIP-1 family-domain-containing protein [Ilyonectria robusta]|uniref:TIP-1 family-domain-containing protein n=1 Tax=Ilyonectria robusta TaxID=1079257 RepID=UPI001E8E3A78|nr:TIP-1 family-domain-containing protein [Ilyonectria robusta]KAH8706717.1 TIP-1 family-domain-containing protein [Ilyonectria robusta]